MARVTDFNIIGKTAGFIHYKRFGKHYYRSMPTNVSNPRTPEQMRGRTQFGETSKFASSVLKELIHPYWNFVAHKDGRTGYNYFVQSNLPAFKSGEMAAEKIILCPENGLIQENFVVKEENACLFLSWKSDRPEAKSAGNTDALCLLVLSQEQGLNIIENIAKREDHQVEIERIGDGTQHYFVFWKRGHYWSESKWLCSNIHD